MSVFWECVVNRHETLISMELIVIRVHVTLYSSTLSFREERQKQAGARWCQHLGGHSWAGTPPCRVRSSEHLAEIGRGKVHRGQHRMAAICSRHPGFLVRKEQPRGEHSLL